MKNITDILENAHRHFGLQLPFVIYSKPDESKVYALFQRDNALNSTADLDDNGFVFAPFHGNKFVIIRESESELATVEFDADPSFEFPQIGETNTGKLEFEKLVEKGIAAIENGDFGKVVLARKEVVNLKAIQFTQLFSNLLNAYPSAFRYCWYHPEIGMWMGATPEKLLQAKGNIIRTMALAGTQKFNGEEQIEWADKEKQEQEFVTDFIVYNLKSMVADLAISKPYTAKAGNLLHIRTDIKGTLDGNSDLVEIVKTLHPTPAVCGLPKAAARKFILANEGFDREYYSGFLGEIRSNSENNQIDADLYVNLRCFQLKASNAYLYMGCGITKDSDPKKEYIETVNKSMTMKKILWK